MSDTPKKPRASRKPKAATDEGQTVSAPGQTVSVRRTAKPAAEGLRIEYMPIAELLGRRFRGNPRSHDDEAIRGSVERFGFADPIALDEKSGSISEGHGRLEALRAMREAGETPPENVRAAPDGSDWLVPVVRGASFKSKAELERYIVAHNQTTIAGGWESRLLAGILQRAQESNVPSIAMGFSSQSIAKIIAGVKPLTPESGWANTDKDRDESVKARRFVLEMMIAIDESEIVERAISLAQTRGEPIATRAAALRAVCADFIARHGGK